MFAIEIKFKLIWFISLDLTQNSFFEFLMLNAYFNLNLCPPMTIPFYVRLKNYFNECAEIL